MTSNFDIDYILGQFQKLSTDEYRINVGHRTTNSNVGHMDIDNLVNTINDLRFTTGEQECITLVCNYNKLKILRRLVLDNDILLEPLRHFLEKIDVVNQYYLRNINLDPQYYAPTPDSPTDTLTLRLDRESDLTMELHSYDIQSLQNSVTVIGQSLTESLQCNDPVIKLELVIAAYQAMVGVVDQMHGDPLGPPSGHLDESYDESYDDPLDQFDHDLADWERQFKRRRT